LLAKLLRTTGEDKDRAKKSKEVEVASMLSNQFSDFERFDPRYWILYPIRPPADDSCGKRRKRYKSLIDCKNY